MLSLILGASALLAGQAAADCTREMLGEVANNFIASAKLDGRSYKVSSTYNYTEQYKPVVDTRGVFAKAIKIAHTRTLIDGPNCGVYVEIIAPDNTPGYQLATQVFVDELGNANKVDVIVTSSEPNSNSWFYNGQIALQVLQKEESAGQRAVIPEGQRASRKHLQSVADAYFTIFGSSAGGPKKVPNFSTGCLRQEGGFPREIGCLIGVGTATQPKGTAPSCGTNSTTPHPDIRGYIIDETVGSVEVFAKFAGAPDSHDFRIEGCEVVLVHAVTTTAGGAMSGLMAGMQGLLGGASATGSPTRNGSGISGVLTGLGSLLGGARPSSGAP